MGLRHLLRAGGGLLLVSTLSVGLVALPAGAAAKAATTKVAVATTMVGVSELRAGEQVLESHGVNSPAALEQLLSNHGVSAANLQSRADALRSATGKSVVQYVGDLIARSLVLTPHRSGGYSAWEVGSFAFGASGLLGALDAIEIGLLFAL